MFKIILFDMLLNPSFKMTTVSPIFDNKMVTSLLKAGLYFSMKPDKIRKSEIFTTFEKIHRSFLNNFKSEETKFQIKAYLPHLGNSYFYN